jgi:hypothetical protein
VKKKAFFAYLAGMFLLLGLTLYNLIHLFLHPPVDGNVLGSLFELLFVALLMGSLFTLGYIYRWGK